MAIKVLEERLEIHDNCKKCIEFSNFEPQPCEDCISREAVIKIFGEVHPMDYNTQAYITNIQNLPSVTPKGVTITDFADRCRECGRIKYSNLQDWLSTFNTESATECFTAVQQLKERMNE
jgi:hypothetical protein